MNIRAFSTLALFVFSCTDEPGGTPHASSDTTAPASGATSPESTAAPESTTATATGADATAVATGADTTADPSGPSTGFPTGSTGLTTGDPTGGPGVAGVYARYEVRDNTGTPVEIWAVPACYPGENCYGDFAPLAADCMAVQAVGQMLIGLSYELDTGDPEPCYIDYPTIADYTAYFFDAGCTQPAWLTGTVAKIGGVMHFAPKSTSVVPANWYNGTPAMCFAVANTSFRFSAPEPVPPAILGLLGDAPYEVAIAY